MSLLISVVFCRQVFKSINEYHFFTFNETANRHWTILLVYKLILYFPESILKKREG